MSCPSSVSVPLLTSCSPVIALKIVVLPAPFGPMSPVTHPRSTSRSTSFTALWPPKRMVSPRASNSAIAVLRREAQLAFERAQLAAP